MRKIFKNIWHELEGLHLYVAAKFWLKLAKAFRNFIAQSGRDMSEYDNNIREMTRIIKEIETA